MYGFTKSSAGRASIFPAMAVVHSWPLASDPVHLSRLDNHDAELADVDRGVGRAHPAARATAACSRRRSSIPEHHTLAFSEHMFVPSVMGAPLLGWRLPRPGLQPADHRRPRALGLGDVPADGAMDRKRRGRRIAGLALRLQRARADAVRAPAGAACRVFPLHAVRARSGASSRRLSSRRVAARGRVRAAGAVQQLPAGVLDLCLLVSVAVRWNELSRTTWILLVAPASLSIVALFPFLWPVLPGRPGARPGARRQRRHPIQRRVARLPRQPADACISRGGATCSTKGEPRFFPA